MAKAATTAPNNSLANTALTLTRVERAQMKKNSGKAARLLRSLANENRLMILCSLAAGELSVGELHSQLKGLSQSSLSQHLAVLRTQGHVQTRRQSQTIYYRLAPSQALPIVQTLYDLFCAPK